MKITALAKILISILFLVVVPTSCEKEKLAIAKKTDNTAEIKRLTIIGDNYFDESEFSKAFNVYEKILSISDPAKDRIDYVDALISIGYIYQFQGDYIQSQATATKILPHLKYLKKTRFASDTYNLLGYAYLNTHDFESAISYYKKAYNLKTSEWRKLNALSNIALTYMYKRDYHKAIDIYTKVISESYYTERQKTNTFKDYELVAFGTILDNLGICYFHTNNPKALYYFNKALEIRLKTNDLQDIAFSYSNLSGYYLKKNPDLAKKYAQTSYKIACKINNFRDKKYSLINLIEASNGNDLKKYTNLYIKFTDTAEVKKLTTIGDSYFDNGDFKNSYPIYKKIISIADPVKDRVDYLDALIGLALIYQYHGDYIQSEEMIVKVLPHLKYMKKKRFAWYTYFIQGYNCFKTDNLERALFYYRKALHLKISTTRKWRIINCIGIVYMKQKKYRAAAYIFEKVTTDGYSDQNLAIGKATRMVLLTYCVELNNLGICYYNLKNPKALDIYKKVLKIRLQLNDREDISSSYTVLSEYYLESNPQLAAKYAQLGYKKASEVNFFADKKYCLGFLTKSTTGDELKKYSKMYISFIDSTNTAQLKQKNQFSDIKYNFKQDKEENLELKTKRAEAELEMQRQKNRSFISYTIISIAFVGFIFLIFFMKRKEIRERNDAVFKNEMRISEKLQNELEKDIHRTLLFATNENIESSDNKELFLTDLNHIYLKTRSISRENSAIQTGENYATELKEMISGYTSPKLNIIVNGLNTFSWTKINRVKKITVSRVLQEILDQMKTLNDASLVSLTFKKEEKNIIIMYTDNGKKINSKYIILEKRLQNVENRIKTIKGTLNFDPYSENGFKINFKFPI